MKIKVCGMKDPYNIGQLAALPIDYMGLIFYAPSPRYVQDLQPGVLDVLHDNIGRVGVFVNEELPVVLEQIEAYKLDVVQLHGKESPEYCLECWKLSNIAVVKAFNVASAVDFEQTRHYEGVCNYFLFDTKTPQHGGSGLKFDWSILDAYTGNTPFFLSGGISVEDVSAIKKLSHPQLYALDLNSKFESEPGLKNITQLEQFITQLKK